MGMAEPGEAGGGLTEVHVEVWGLSHTSIFQLKHSMDQWQDAFVYIENLYIFFFAFTAIYQSIYLSIGSYIFFVMKVLALAFEV